MKLFLLLLLQIGWVSAAVPNDLYNYTKYCFIDLVFVLDESGNISDEEFNQELEFVHDIVAHFVIGYIGTQVALVTFNETATSHFLLRTYGDNQKFQLLDAILAIQPNGGDTSIHEGLELARTVSLNRFNGARENIPQVREVVIVLTDGFSNSTAALAEATLLHNNGVTVLAIGIGDDVDNQVLEHVASNPDEDHVFHADFDSLSSILDRVMTSACNNCGYFGPGWIPSPVTNSCYRFVEKDLSCRRAKKYCKEKATSQSSVTAGYPMLVRIESERENTWLHDMISNMGGGNRYIGMTVRRDKDPMEMWNDCPNDYAHWTHWAPNEPNDHENNGETCVQMIQKGERGGYWNDVPPRKTTKFICEIPYESTIWCSTTFGIYNHLQSEDMCLLSTTPNCYWGWGTKYYLGPESYEFTCAAPCASNFRVYA